MSAVVTQRLTTMRLVNSLPMQEITRRDFCIGASGSVGLWLMRSAVAAPATANLTGTPTRPDVAAIDQGRILSAARQWLSEKPVALTSLPCPRSPGLPGDYFSETEDGDADFSKSPTPKAGSPKIDVPPAFTAHRDALFRFGLAVPALASAYQLTREEPFAAGAVAWLRAWMIDAATRMTPAMEYGQTSREGKAGRMEGIVEALPLVEVALAIPFLAASPSFTEADDKAVRAWFAAYLDWLTRPQDSGPRLAALARDSKDHHGTSWLLQASALAILAAEGSDAARAEDAMLAQLREYYKHVLLRAQLTADGTFPSELTSANPYRNSLFNLDMMAGVCHLLSTRFDSVWNYSLEDGPGMRSAIAYHFPYIADPSTWPYKADLQYFKQLPGRRGSLLLAAGAYDRPEYAGVWKTLTPDAASPEIERTMPIHQPLLWVTQPRRRA
jgi:hypothetical protein